MSDEASTRELSAKTRLPVALAGLGFIGIGVLGEPLVGVFRKTVMLNVVGLSAFAAWTAVTVAALLVSVRARSSHHGHLINIVTTISVLQVGLAVMTWVVILKTQAWDRATSPGPVDLFETLDEHPQAGH